MNYAVVKRKDKKYIECASAKTPIHNEQNALDLIAACIEHDTNLLMIHMEALDDDYITKVYKLPHKSDDCYYGQSKS